MGEDYPPHLSVGHLHVVVQWLHLGSDTLTVGVKGLAEGVALCGGK